jgi:hypothetical protein
MDTTDTNTPTPTGGPGDLSTADFTVTKYQELADNHSKGLDALIATVPHFEQRHESSEAFVFSHVGIPADFVSSTVAAVHENPGFQRYAALDVLQGRNATQFLDAYRPISEKLMAQGRDLAFTCDAIFANLASSSLDTYAIAKRVVRNPENAGLTQHVANMKRKLGRGRPRKKVTPNPSPSTTPAPGTTPSTGGTTSPGSSTPGTSSPPVTTNPPAKTTVDVGK